MPSTDRSYQCLKRDHACIWFAHLPPEVATPLATLSPNEPVRLLINDEETIWRRMKPGGGRPTPGIRIELGKGLWSRIDIGVGFMLRLAPASMPLESLEVSQPVMIAEGTDDRPQLIPAAGTPLFGAYLFIDYSGAEKVAHQRRAIRIAYGEGGNAVSLINDRHDRIALVDFIFERLRSASRRGVRVCLGQDHSLGMPVGFARELGISSMPLREALAAFLGGTYSPAAPAFHGVGQFVRELNCWLTDRGRKPYFWSATKAELYQVPGTDPRKGEMNSCAYRLTDRCRSGSGRGNPKPFNRIGDRGTVGGQSLLGMVRILELIDRCEAEGLKLRFWPFDGLDITSPEYEGAHVFVEPYPSAFRPEGVEQTDANDAIHTALAIQEADLQGLLRSLFDLSDLRADDVPTVLFEGWIVGNLVETTRA